MVVVPYSVGAAEVKIASGSPTRTSVVVMNHHATAVIYIRFSKGVAVSNGIPIYPHGFSSLKIPEDDPTTEIWAISDTPTTDVRVYEGYGK